MLGVLVAIKSAEYARKARQYTDPNGPHAEMVASAKSKFAQCRNGVANCIDGAGRFVDEQTGGKYSDKINLGLDKAKTFLVDDDDYRGGGDPEAPDAPDDREASSTLGHGTGSE